MTSVARAAVLMIAVACSAKPAKDTMNPGATKPSPLQADAVAGIKDSALRAIVADHWEQMMRAAPTYATTLGDHRYDDQLAPRDAASIQARNAERDSLIDRLRKIDPASLTPVDAVTFKLLRGQLEAEQGLEVCRMHEWFVDAGGSSVFDELSYLVEQHGVKTPGDAQNLVARMRQSPKLVDDTIANLTIGLGAGRVSSAEKLRRAIAQLDAELDKPAESWAMATPKWASADPDPWPEGVRDQLNAQLREIVSQQIVPAIVRYRDFLRDNLMPKARTSKEGLVGIPDGDACYRASILHYVGIPMTAQALHELGQSEISRTDREILELGRRVLGTDSLVATLTKLREDKTLYFTSREELMTAAQRSLDRAKAVMGRFFSVLPKADCVMREIPEHEAPYTTIAYYRQPHYDGSKPGEYFVNTYKPQTRPRFELEALTWHESIPGHHLQIAIAQELGELPAFRKLNGSTAFVEGWALYTERLAEEMGLYSADLDRFGKLSYDAWRASRLVVDTGIHALGWTRAQAEGFMRDHTALTTINISNEVDRYIGWPGQALAYKVGQLEILRLRKDAEAALGARFELPLFHDVVLGAGAVTLPVLGDRVKAWVESLK